MLGSAAVRVPLLELVNKVFSIGPSWSRSLRGTLPAPEEDLEGPRSRVGVTDVSIGDGDSGLMGDRATVVMVGEDTECGLMSQEQPREDREGLFVFSQKGQL